MTGFVERLREAFGDRVQVGELLAPLTTSAPLSRVHDTIRARVARLDADRPPAPDITTIDALIASGDVEHSAGFVVK